LCSKPDEPDGETVVVMVGYIGVLSDCPHEGLPRGTKSHGMGLMTMRKAIHKNQSEVLTTPSDLVEEKLLASAGLVAHVNPEDALQRNTTAKRTAISVPRRSRGPVDAPGKRHRKPLSPERIERQMGEPRGKQMGQKNAKTGRRGGRS
jgi:hypothetical protein